MTDTSLRYTFEDYKNALARLQEGLDLNSEEQIIIDGVIQRFEFTFELSWKLMKKYLEKQGIKDCNSPRSVIKEAFAQEIISDGDAWIDMMVDRNLTSHLYDEIHAKEIYKKIKDKHVKLFEELLKKFNEFYEL
ncbi:nucleotidyltransferase substrate binding protein [bacterium]|nr:nucleotidyltransferase substrate binding protein [bacterium]